MCHSTSGAASAGPGLDGILGRPIGGVEAYNYSEAMTKAGAAGR